MEAAVHNVDQTNTNIKHIDTFIFLQKYQSSNSLAAQWNPIAVVISRSHRSVSSLEDDFTILQIVSDAHGVSTMLSDLLLEAEPSWNQPESLEIKHDEIK